MSRSNWQTTPLSSSPRLSSGPPARRGRLSFFVQGLLVAVLVALLLFFVGLIGATTVYAYYALTLPPAEELGARTLFLSTKIYDRHGQLLYEVFDANAGRRTYVPIVEIPEDLIHATISTEDKTFYSNPGFDPLAIARAVWLNVTEGEIVTGASTITQQLVKNILLSPEQTFTRKLQEAILAQEITRRYSKDQILEIYLNEIYYGNMSYGIEAAAETYFGKQARDLTLAEASMLAGSMGMLPSASLAGIPKEGEAIFGLYEPIHGSSPKRAGLNMANPIATILSSAMMLRYSLGLTKEAETIEKAVTKTLNDGYRTYDIMSESMVKVGTREMGDLIASRV